MSQSQTTVATSTRVPNTQPSLENAADGASSIWQYYSLAAAIQFFAEPDGVCRQFHQAFMDHTKLSDATVCMKLIAMIKAGCVIVVEKGNSYGHRSVHRPAGLRLHPAIASLFPRLSARKKAPSDGGRLPQIRSAPET